jgi:glutathione synthase/RimK-type ligase-like ATP-grasp enzyme
MALQAAGCEAHATEWDDAAVDWSSFDVVLLRSAWDYAERITEFRAWVERTAAVTHVLNPPAVVRWNTDKHYLARLAEKGVAIVPTRFVEPGQDAARALAEVLDQHTNTELVIKPTVGAGARDAQRHGRADTKAALAHMDRLLAQGRSVLVQPFLERVNDEGETALIFFEGRFSHAIRKGLLLAAGSGPTAGLFAPETISVRTPGADERKLAEQAIAAIPFETLLYTRIDLIRGDEGEPRLLELELTEPSLYFSYAAGSAEQFTAALLRRYPPSARG